MFGDCILILDQRQAFVFPADLPRAGKEPHVNRTNEHAHGGYARTIQRISIKDGVSISLWACVYACMYACMYVCVCQFHFARRWGETESARTRKLQDPATAQLKNTP